MEVEFTREPEGQVPVQAHGRVRRTESDPWQCWYFRARGSIAIRVWAVGVEWADPLPHGEVEWSECDWPAAEGHRWKDAWANSSVEPYPGWMSHDCARELCLQGLALWAVGEGWGSVDPEVAAAEIEAAAESERGAE